MPGVTGLTGTITGGTISDLGGSAADDKLYRQSVDRMLGAGVDTTQMFQQQMLRMNADDQSHAMAARRTDATTTQLVTYVGAQALLGSDPTLQAGILSARTVEAQPQTTGALVNPGVTQGQAAPAVYAIGPTGTISKV
jgi:hypothetical protein